MSLISIAKRCWIPTIIWRIKYYKVGNTKMPAKVFQIYSYLLVYNATSKKEIFCVKMAEKVIFGLVDFFAKS